jgi:hypothetical protein
VYGRWLDCHGADAIVWAVIRSRFVDWQKLNKLESDFCDPINKLPQRTEITDSRIVLSSQREQWRENSSDLLFWRKIHQEDDK